MKKLLSLLLVCVACTVFAQDKDTITTKTKTIYCQIYTIDQGHLRYREKGVGKIIPCSDVISCSIPWRHVVDSLNHSNAVQPNTLDISKISDSVKYCEIVGWESGKNINIKIDVGQKLRTTFFGLIKISDYLVDRNGQIKSFNSMIDALNFMIDNGWEFVTCYAITEPAPYGNVYHYLLKRK